MSVLAVAAELVAAIRDRLERSAIAGTRYDYAAGEALIILQWALDHAGSGDQVGAEQMLRAATECLPGMPVETAPGEMHARWARLVESRALSEP